MSMGKSLLKDKPEVGQAFARAYIRTINTYFAGNYHQDDKVMAVFPATVGSTDKPSPTGVHKVQGVSRDPDYVYDPKKLTWGPKSEGRFVVKAGPNNPVGSVWIDLNAPSYGIHGSPEPKVIGKTASHGCVRLTNWDALLLSTAVKSGVKVAFVNARA